MPPKKSAPKQKWIPKEEKKASYKDKEELHNYLGLTQIAIGINPYDRERVLSRTYQIIGAVLADKIDTIDVIRDPYKGEHHFKTLPKKYYKDTREILDYIFVKKSGATSSRFQHLLVYWYQGLIKEIGDKTGDSLKLAISQNKLVKEIREQLEKNKQERSVASSAPPAAAPAPASAADIFLDSRMADMVGDREGAKKLRKEAAKTAIKENKKSKEDKAQSAGPWQIDDSIAKNILSTIYIETYYMLSDEGRHEEAFQYCKRADELGDVMASSIMGDLYSKGKGVAKEPSKSIPFWEKSYKDITTDAHNLGYAYEYGKGVEKNLDRAIFYYEFAANNGEYLSAAVVGGIYLSQKKYEQALKWLKLAADNGDREAQFNVGSLYFNGLGCDRNIDIALGYYESSAKQGLKEAIDMLAELYLKESNYKKAFPYLKELAFTHKDTNTQYVLGVILLSGLETIEANPSMAVDLIKEAAAKNHEKSIKLLKDLQENNPEYFVKKAKPKTSPSSSSGKSAKEKKKETLIS